MEFKSVTRYTRAGHAGKVLKCPKCGEHHRVFHFAWSALGCTSCNAMVNKYEWLVQARDARTKTSDPSIQEALAIGCTIYVTSKFDDTWLSFYYMCDEGEVQVLKGKGNMGIGRDLMLLDRALKDLAGYEANTEGWNVEVKG